MMSHHPVGAVSSLRRYPIKSMLGEQLSTATFGPRGLVGDRAYALVDQETSKVVSVKRPKLWGRLFELTATTTPGGVRVRFPEGAVVAADDDALPRRLSAFFGRPVALASVPPPAATFDEVWGA